MKDYTFVAIGIAIGVALAVIMLIISFTEGLSLDDAQVCLGAIILLKLLCALSHKMVNPKKITGQLNGMPCSVII